MANNQGYINALLAALLFGISTTLNKLVLKDTSPLLAAGLIYLSAGILLYIIRFTPFSKNLLERFKIKFEEKKLSKNDWTYLFAIAIFGAAIGPFLFLKGLSLSNATNASLLINMEVLFTIIIAFLFLKEEAKLKDHIAILIIFISAIAINTNLSFSGISLSQNISGNLLIITATLFWALDNSLSKKLSVENDVIKVASYKSLIGGSLVLLMALISGNSFNIELATIPYILIVGFFSIGLSLVLFLSSLRLIGSMRTIVIFSTASLFGVVFAFIFLKEPVTLVQVASGIFMILGVYIISKE